MPISKVERKRAEWLISLGMITPDFSEYWFAFRAEDAVKAGWLNFFSYIRKNMCALKTLCSTLNDTNCEEWELRIKDGELDLWWRWDDDNGLYCTSGTMRAIYLPEKADKTWSFSETQELIEELGLDSKKISNFKDLIKEIGVKSSLAAERGE